METTPFKRSNNRIDKKKTRLLILFIGIFSCLLHAFQGYASSVAVNVTQDPQGADYRELGMAAHSANTTDRIITPNGDGVNDAAIFGSQAIKVEIFDVAGKTVWSGTGDGSNPIQWNGMDAQNDILESGVYFFQEQGANGSATNGVIAIAK